ncbi:cytochrome P450 [Candidatus Thiosymbion oneisti]|uniref:cytochrome P450 n=1 Tax=Candidatus Thiosymbion oneisti TaxID=589554 RepID=UPI000B7FF8F2|nr:cytochrome P450 [Candidatus Thiosymbion oneisti]
MQFNPRNSAFRANPYPVYHRLRIQDPIHYRQAKQDWLLTRYADMIALLNDDRIDPRNDTDTAREIVENRPRVQVQAGMLPEAFLRLRQESEHLRRHWIIVTHPPVHTRLREVLRPFFSRNKIAVLQSWIQQQAERLLDRALASGELDIIHDFSSPLMSEAICELLGIPVEDRKQLRPLAYELSTSIDLDSPPTTDERGLFAFLKLARYFRSLIARLQSRIEPEDNLLKGMIRAHAQGHLSEDELLANSIFLFFTGHGAPQHVIGNGMFALLRHPDQLQLLQAEPALIGAATDECLRYDCPGQYMIRRALDDIEFRGKTFKKGQKIVFLIGAANRDPDQFPEPDRFDIYRKPNKYLTFGYGMRYCMGAQLTRSAAQIGLETLIRRLPRIALKTETLEWEESYRTHGLKSLPVTF